MTLTPDKLAVIAARLEAATPGPWQADTSDPDDVVVWGPLPDSFIANVGDWTFHGEAPGQRAVVVVEVGADAALIAHAPTDLAACLRHIAAQQERIEMWEDGLSECRSVHKLQAKVERLERVLARVLEIHKHRHEFTSVDVKEAHNAAESALRGEP